MFASRLNLLALAALAACAPNVLAEDPNLPDRAILAYFPAISSAVTIGVLFLLVAVALQLRIQLTRPRLWYGLTLSIAALASSAGWFMRIALRQNVASLGLYIITTLLVILPPASIIAFAYITYGRIIVAVDPNCARAGKRTVRSSYSFIPPRLVTLIFVTSDITTFIIQAIGGAMASQQEGNVADVGNNVFLAGVALQGASYFLFVILAIFAWFRLRKLDPEALRFFALRSNNPHLHPVVPIFQTIAATSIFIIIRSVFRIVEMAEGYRGTLMSSEVYLIVLDAVPILITSIIWSVFWPANLLEEARAAGATKEMDVEAPKNLSDPALGYDTPSSFGQHQQATQVTTPASSADMSIAHSTVSRA